MRVTHLFQQAAERSVASTAVGRQWQAPGFGAPCARSAAPQRSMDSSLCTDLLKHGLTVRLHNDPATLYRALSQPQPAAGSEVVLIHATLPVAVRLTCQLRRHSENVPVVALPPSVSQEGLLLAMQAGIDACWPAEAPLSLLAESLSRLQTRSTPVQPVSAAAPAAWELVARGWKVQTPEGRFVSLTATERAIMLALARAPQYRLAHDALIRHAAAGSTPVSLPVARRRLGVLISRLRRKFETLGAEPPIRSVRAVGYELCIEFQAPARAVAAVRETETPPAVLP